VVRQVLNLPSHPQVPPPGEGLRQGGLDLVVETPNREDTGALPGASLLSPLEALVNAIVSPDRRRLGVEEPAGAARRRR
jgi:hypothetical protein